MYELELTYKIVFCLSMLCEALMFILYVAENIKHEKKENQHALENRKLKTKIKVRDNEIDDLHTEIDNLKAELKKAALVIKAKK